MTHKVVITRIEVYTEVVEVDATNSANAVEKVQDAYGNGEYDYMFDCPDIVESRFKGLE